MKAITYLASFTLAGAALVSSAFANTPKGWSTDLDQALKDAKAQNKAVLVEFTGSDWCPPCMLMRKNVFSKEEFIAAASQEFILVELDFPNGNPALTKENQPLAEKYNVEGFPTVILLNPAGKEYARTLGAEYRDVDSFLKWLADSKTEADPSL